MTADKEEQLKVYSDEGEFLGVYENRSVVHKMGLYHQEVAFIPLNQKGEIDRKSVV